MNDMKYKIIILILSALCVNVCQGQVVNERFVPEWFNDAYSDLGLQKSYEIGMYLKPQYLEDDFNGDGMEDGVVTIINSSNGKLGLLIIFKGSNEHFIIAAGNGFYHSDDFKWMNTWEIFDQGITYETTFLENGDVGGEREVKLENVAISIREDEGSGGLVYYNGVEFVWIHQGD